MTLVRWLVGSNFYTALLHSLVVTLVSVFYHSDFSVITLHLAHQKLWEGVVRSADDENSAVATDTVKLVLVFGTITSLSVRVRFWRGTSLLMKALSILSIMVFLEDS